MKNLKQINERLIEISTEKPKRIFSYKVNFTNSTEDYIEGINIDDLDTESNELQLQRQLILDKRENLTNKFIWSVLAPIVVSIVTTLIVIYIKPE